MDPEKNSPRKVDRKKLQEGLSEKTKNKIMYECDLLRMSPDTLLSIAPHIFFIEEPEIIPDKKFIPSEYSSYEGYYPNEDDYAWKQAMK